MLAANIWHWWVGVLLTLVGILAVLGVIAGYLKSVTAQRIQPERGRDSARQQDL